MSHTGLTRYPFQGQVQYLGPIPMQFLAGFHGDAFLSSNKSEIVAKNDIQYRAVYVVYAMTCTFLSVSK
jgi:hypothetical protein